MLALMGVGEHVADDARWRLEFIKVLAVFLIVTLEVAFERAVAGDPASRGEDARPDRKWLLVRPDDLTFAGIQAMKLPMPPWLSGAGNIESVAPTYG